MSQQTYPMPDPWHKGVMVLREEADGMSVSTRIVYRNCTFDIDVYSVLDGDEPVTYGAEITEILGTEVVPGYGGVHERTAEWDGSDETYDTSEDAYRAAVDAIIETVDDHPDEHGIEINVDHLLRRLEDEIDR